MWIGFVMWSFPQFMFWIMGKSNLADALTQKDGDDDEDEKKDDDKSDKSNDSDSMEESKRGK